jgi:hypothetical protein
MVESSSRGAFELAMKLAFWGRQTATHFLIDKQVDALVLFWHDPTDDWPEAKKLPKPIDVAMAIEWAWDWLGLRLSDKMWPATYADGLSGSFRLKAGGEFRLHWRDGYMPSDGSPYGIVAIYPTWSEVHK